VRFLVLEAVSKKMTAFLEIAPCILVEADRRFITIMMGAVIAPETSVYLNETKRRYFQESCHFPQLGSVRSLKAHCVIFQCRKEAQA
jgi:hypothetical protein